MTILNRPTLTDVYTTLDSFIPAADSAYVFGTSGEERCAHSQSWEAKASDVLFIRVIQQQDETFEVEIGHDQVTVSMRSTKQLGEMLRKIGKTKVYLDITGLDHKVWAPLLRAGLSLGLTILVVYVEPGHYKFNHYPLEGDIFDLSASINGISPLPGFASLTEVDEQFVHFIPLLGFEGIRFKHIVEQMQPDSSRIIPIVGVPGFSGRVSIFHIRW